MADVVAQKRASAKEVAQGIDDGTESEDALILEAIETPIEKRRNLAFILYGG